MSNPRSFAIVGCGMAGLAASICLSRSGHEVSLYEQFSQPASIGAGILLQPSGMQVLRRLGLLADMEANAARIDGLQGLNSAGQLVMDVAYRDLAPDAYALGVHRANLFDLLYRASIEAGVEIVCGARVDAFERDSAANRIRVIGAGLPERDFDALIIANGTQSSLRSRLDIPGSATYYPWSALWAICPDPRNRYRALLAQRYHRASKMIGVLPSGLHPETGEPCVSFFWSLAVRDFEAWQSRDLEEWKAEVLGYWPEIHDLVESIQSRDTLAFANYGDVIMPRWHDGAVVCIGDAAHAMSPQLGQGANLALIDAFVLNACVGSCADLPAAFSRYSELRRAHIRFYQFASRWLTPLFQSDNRLAAAVRDFVFPVLQRMPALRRQAVRTVAGLKTGILLDKPLSGIGFE